MCGILAVLGCTDNSQAKRSRIIELSRSMLKTLERYHKCSYGAVEVSNKPAKELETSYREYVKLKTRFESLQRTQRNLLGEDLGPLNTKDLEQLERQLEASLKQVRSTKAVVETHDRCTIWSAFVGRVRFICRCCCCLPPLGRDSLNPNVLTLLLTRERHVTFFY